MASEPPTGGESKSGPQFHCRLLYLKDLSFESPHVPDMLFGHDKPELRSVVECSHKLRKAGVFDVLLEITVHAMAGDKSLFLIEVKQGGIFDVSGYSTDETIAILKTRAPETLYPYARELISSMASRGGFPRLQLRPLDFHALYVEAQSNRKNA